MAKIKCPYKYSALSRAAKVDFICGIGGYGNRDGRWPISFDVALHASDITFDNLWDKYRKDCGIVVPEEEEAEYRRVAEKAYANVQYSLFEFAQEDCIRDCVSGYSDTYFMLWDGRSVDVDLEFRGRCGKHLVISRFRSLQMRGLTPDALRDTLMMQSDGVDDFCNRRRLQKGYAWDYSAEFVDTLYRYCVQCVADFTPEKASANHEYYAAERLFARAEGLWGEERENHEAHAAVVGCAQTLRRYLEADQGVAVMHMLHTLSKAAGVSEEEYRG